MKTFQKGDMLSKDKCGWCGLKFDFIIRKPKLLIEDVNEYLCEGCAKKFKDETVEI